MLGNAIIFNCSTYLLVHASIADFFSSWMSISNRFVPQTPLSWRPLTASRRRMWRICGGCTERWVHELGIVTNDMEDTCARGTGTCQ